MGDWIPKGEMSFLAGRSEMAQRIRAHDWSRHPFGPVTTWPQSLRSAVSICLHSAFPTAIYWGPELRLLYNDAWAPIPGPRHPAALGAPAKEVWADIWHVIEPQIERLLETGEGLFFENTMLPMARFGAPEETYWSYSFTAIRGEDGKISGIFNSGNETTVMVRTERQMRFLLEHSEALRSADTADEGRRISLQMVARHLGVDRAGFVERAESGEMAIIDEWTAEGVVGTGRIDDLAELGPVLGEGLQAGHSVSADDTAQDLRFREVARAKFAQRGIAAFIAVPWMVRGRFVGVAYLHQSTPRAWSDFDVTTVESMLERTLSWMEARRAAEREQIMVREIEHRARNALTVAQAIVRMTHADDADAFREKVENRIGALARAHGLFSGRQWRSLDFGSLLKLELEPHATDDARVVRTDGPKVSLPPETAQTVALVLHELATNATKHGALAAADGWLDIAWCVDDAGTLVIDWRETTPQTKLEPPQHRGFGTVLLAQVVEAQLGGTIDSDFAADGLKVCVRIPLG